MNHAFFKAILLFCVTMTAVGFAEEPDLDALEKSAADPQTASLDMPADAPVESNFNVPDDAPAPQDVNQAQTLDLESSVATPAETTAAAAAPQPLDQDLEVVVDTRRDAAADGPEDGAREIGLNGKPVSPAIRNVRELDTIFPGVKWSAGLGVQNFLKSDLYFQANLERLFLPNLAIGFLGTTLGSFGGPATNTATVAATQGAQFLGTVNIHSQRQFRGLWFQGRGGITVFKNQPIGTDLEGHVTILPTVGASVGWRFALADNAGRDDAFSVSVSAGGELWIGHLNVAGIDAPALYPQPVLRAELNWGF